MNILIFKTVNEERTRRLLYNTDTVKNTIYMVMPESEVGIYDGLGMSIHCIGTNKKYIDYKTVAEENKIPDIKFHEIWVLSPNYGNLYTYWEVYAVISELKYDRVFYKAIGKDRIESYDLEKENIFSRTHALMVRAVRAYTVLIYWIEKKVKAKGYK